MGNPINYTQTYTKVDSKSITTKKRRCNLWCDTGFWQKTIERLPESHLAFVESVMIRLLLRRLAKKWLFKQPLTNNKKKWFSWYTFLILCQKHLCSLWSLSFIGDFFGTPRFLNMTFSPISSLTDFHLLVLKCHYLYLDDLQNPSLGAYNNYSFYVYLQS